MKREYAKPMLYAENFELLEHISGRGCVTVDMSMTTHRSAEAGCGYFLDPSKRFNDDVVFQNMEGGDCTWFDVDPTTELGEYNGLVITASGIFSS